MRYILCIFLSLILSACNTNTVANDFPSDYMITLNDEQVKAYSNGDSILLYAYNKADFNDESYSDWSHYLNQFSEDTKGTFIIREIKSNVLASNNKNIVEENFSVFLKKGMPSYVYQGAIFESQVYTAIDNVYKARELTEEDKAFLTPEASVEIKAE